MFPIIVMLIIDTFETVSDPAKLKQIKWFNNLRFKSSKSKVICSLRNKKGVTLKLKTLFSIICMTETI